MREDVIIWDKIYVSTGNIWPHGKARYYTKTRREETDVEYVRADLIPVLPEQPDSLANQTVRPDVIAEIDRMERQAEPETCDHDPFHDDRDTHCVICGAFIPCKSGRGVRCPNKSPDLFFTDSAKKIKNS